ncbi:hypothetical protein J7S33_11815, partial [Saccharothrix algeriensis]
MQTTIEDALTGRVLLSDALARVEPVLVAAGRRAAVVPGSRPVGGPAAGAERDRGRPLRGAAE